VFILEGVVPFLVEISLVAIHKKHIEGHEEGLLNAGWVLNEDLI